MRWHRREDDARRMKGDPPPTYAQLLALAKQQGEIIRNLCHQRDELKAEVRALRAAALPQLTRPWPWTRT